MPADEAQPRNAVGIIGRIEPFEDTVETWTSYTERLEQYFEVNDIAEDKKVPVNNGHITTVNNDRYRISVSQMTTDMFRLS